MKKKLLAVLASGVLMLGMVSVSQALTYTYATDVRWDNGTGAAPSSAAGNRYNQTSALYAPDSSFLSLGRGGLAVFDFGVEFNAAAIVFETTNGTRSAYPELANVYVANSLYNFSGLATGNGAASISTLDFTSVGQINNSASSTELDLSSLAGPFRYVLIQDATTWTGSPDGFDVNAVGVAPVPEPGTMMLLGIGMLGMAVYGKRRMNKEAQCEAVDRDLCKGVTSVTPLLCVGKTYTGAMKHNSQWPVSKQGGELLFRYYYERGI